MSEQKIDKEIDITKQSEFYKKQKEKLKTFFIDKNFLIIFLAISVFIIDISVISFFLVPDNLRKDFSDKYFFNKNETIREDGEEAIVEEENNEDDNDDCNVVGVNLHGDLVTYIPLSDYSSYGDILFDESSSEDIYFAIRNAEKQDNIKAIILEVDSFGGVPAAAEEINLIVEKTSKPVIAYIRGAGNSAAYWAISGASKIFSLSTSQVGSIAVNGSYLDNTKNNEQNGYTFNNLSTGEFKNTPSPDKSLTESEKNLIMRDLQATHELFVNVVAKNRNLNVNDVKKIANGWAYNGNEALELGLVDEIGNLDSVKEYIEKNILDNQQIDICWK
mgnify:CR=1 FL=1